MIAQDIVEKLKVIAKEFGEIARNVYQKLYTTDIEVIAKYVFILVLAGLLILGLRLLSDEVEEYRDRKKAEHGKMPWYLRDWILFIFIALVILITYAVVFKLVR